METLEFVSEVWAKFVQGQVGIDAVIEEYHKHGFDVNQDIPGNIYWEELYLRWKIRSTAIYYKQYIIYTLHSVTVSLYIFAIDISIQFSS